MDLLNNPIINSLTDLIIPKELCYLIFIYLHDTYVKKCIHVSRIFRGNYVIYSDQAYVVTSIATSKGRGPIKASIAAKNLFTNEKIKFVKSTAHQLFEPIVTKTEYWLTNIDKDGNFILLADSNEIIEMKNEDIEMEKILKNKINEKQIIITLLRAIGKSKIMCYKEIDNDIE